MKRNEGKYELYGSVMGFALLCLLAGFPQPAGADAKFEAGVAAGEPASQAPGGGPGEPAGTEWQLVRIMSMDDSEVEADDPSKYQISFAGEGTAHVVADCNRGNANWVSGQRGQLQFGPLATTRAMCPPGSIADEYLAHFEWVRSYVFRDGHLFLATMADGTIIEFAPAPR